MLSKAAVISALENDLLPAFTSDKTRLTRIDQWARWRHEDLRLPLGATHELRMLRDFARTPWLSLVVDTMSQALVVDGYRAASDAASTGPWQTWLANDFDNRQIAVHRAALTFGTSYVTVLPGQNAQGSQAVMRGSSSRHFLARCDDPASDDWPRYAVRVFAQPDGSLTLSFYDSDATHYLTTDSFGGALTYLSYDVHGAGVCPVVRYSNVLDLDGRSVGEVDPFIDLAARVNKTVFDRLMTQHHSSWRVRYATGPGGARG